jgi:hypothetical protein
MRVVPVRLGPRLLALLGALAVGGAALVLAPSPAQACSNARQQLRYVLGQAGDDLAILSLDLHREDVDGALGDDVRWRGEARLELLGPAGGARVHRRLGSVDVAARAADYPAGLTPVFARAQKMAAQLPGFQPAMRPRYTSCGNLPRCGRVSVVARGGKLHLRDGRTRMVQELSRATVERLLEMGPGIELGDASAQDIDEALGGLRIVHLLRYRIGKRELLVVNLGAGGHRHAWPDLPAWPPVGCTSLAACPPATTTLHHGWHTDVIVR